MRPSFKARITSKLLGVRREPTPKPQNPEGLITF
jgi:hypothetical protein